jgi:hypothetical protein
MPPFLLEIILWSFKQGFDRSVLVSSRGGGI